MKKSNSHWGNNKGDFMKKDKTNSNKYKRLAVYYGCGVLTSNLLEQNKKNDNSGFMLGNPGEGKSFHNRVKSDSENN